MNRFAAIALLMISLLFAEATRAQSSLPLRGPSGETLYTLGTLQGLDYSPTGEHFATRSPLGVFIRETLSGTILHWINETPHAITGVHFTHDGAHLLTPLDTGEIVVWSTATGREVNRWTAHATGIVAMDVSDTHPLLVTGGGEGDNLIHVWVWDDKRNEGRRRATYNPENFPDTVTTSNQGPIHSVALSPNAEQLIVVSGRSRAHRIVLGEPDPVEVRAGVAAGFYDDEHWILYTTAGVRIFNTDSRNAVTSFSHYAFALPDSRVMTSPDKTSIALINPNDDRARDDQVITLSFNTSTDTIRNRFARFAAFTRARNDMLIVHQDQRILRIRTDSIETRVLQTYAGHTAPPVSITPDPNQETFLVSGGDHSTSATLITPETGEITLLDRWVGDQKRNDLVPMRQFILQNFTQGHQPPRDYFVGIADFLEGQEHEAMRFLYTLPTEPTPGVPYGLRYLYLPVPQTIHFTQIADLSNTYRQRHNDGTLRLALGGSKGELVTVSESPHREPRFDVSTSIHDTEITALKADFLYLYAGDTSGRLSVWRGSVNDEPGARTAQTRVGRILFITSQSTPGRPIAEPVIIGTEGIEELDTHLRRKQFTRWDARINAAAQSPNGERIALGLDDGSIVVLTQTLSQEQGLSTGQPVHALTWLDDERLLSGNDQGVVQQWNTGGESSLEQWPMH